MTKNELSLVIEKPNLGKTAVNKTTRFMLPAIELASKKTKLKLLEYYGFVNCYLEHKQGRFTNPQYLYLVFNPSKESLKSFKDFYEIYKTYPNFVTDYVVDYNVIILVFKVGSKWTSTYENFKKSQYSKMSKEYAEFFKSLDMSTGKVEVLQQYLVMTKSKEYREYLEKDLDVTISADAELMNPLDHREIFDYE